MALMGMTVASGCCAQPRHSGESRNPEGPGNGAQSETASLNPLLFPLGHQGGGLCTAPLRALVYEGFVLNKMSLSGDLFRRRI